MKVSELNDKHERATKGDFLSALTLYEHYSKHREVGPGLSGKQKYYADLISEQLDNESLWYESLGLADFRRFGSLNVIIGQRKLFVAIGDNGAGKTSVLEAIAKHLSWLVSSIKSAKPKGQTLDKFDIKIDSDSDYASAYGKFRLSNNVFSIDLVKNRLGRDSQRVSELSGIRDLGKLYRVALGADKPVKLPFFAYYSVERSASLDPRTFDSQLARASKRISTDRFDAYDKSFDGTSNFEYFLAWLKDLFDIKNATSINTDLISQHFSRMTKEGKFAGKEKQLHDLISMLEEENSSNEVSSVDAERHLENVLKSIVKALPDVTEININRTPSVEITVTKKDVAINVLMLSQGEKTLLALVGDIARRLSILNPHMDDPNDAYGVILIDEVDLHLHPSWQRTILSKLQTIFENIQFIVTTHSPIVCTTVHHDSIAILRDESLYKGPKGSKGGDSSRILSQYFNVSPRPGSLENSTLDEYMALVYNDDWDLARAKELRAILDENFGKEEPKLIEADIYIENRSWEIRFEEDSQE